MSEHSTGALRAKSLYSLLDLLREHINSDECQIRLQKSRPDSCGNELHLDAPGFISAFRATIEKQDLDGSRVLNELSLLMELSIYVRNGGSRAMLYRLETGRSYAWQNYFDILADSIRSGIESLQMQAKCRDGGSDTAASSNLNCNETASSSSHDDDSDRPILSLYERLKQVDPDDELRVSAALSEIDELLLSISRKIEQISLENISEPVSGEGDPEPL